MLREWTRWRLPAVVLWLLLVPVVAAVGPSHAGRQSVHEGTRSPVAVVSLPVGSLQAGTGLRPDPRVAAKSGGASQLFVGECSAAFASHLGSADVVAPVGAPSVPRVVLVCSRGRSPPAS